MQAITRPNKKQESLTKNAVYVHLDRLPSQHAFPKYTINIENTSSNQQTVMMQAMTHDKYDP